MSKVNSYDINIHQGETWAMNLTIKDSNDVPKNLTGYTGKMQIRERPGGRLIEDLNTTDGGMTITAVTGEIDLAMTTAKTAALDFKTAYYDLYIQSTAGTRTYLLKGEVILTQRVSV